MKELLEHIITESREHTDAPTNGRGVFSVPLSLLEQDPVPMPRYTRAHIAGALMFVAVAGGFALVGLNHTALPGGSTLSYGERRTESILPQPARTDHFAGIALTAKAAYVYDAATGVVLYAKNEHEALPLASLTKAMTALVAAESGDRASTVAIRPDDVLVEGDSGLLPGEKLPLKDILDFTLVASSNDGAHAVAAWAGGSVDDTSGAYGAPEDRFVVRMNEHAKKIGLADTTFSNPTGLDLSSYTAGAYGSARDMAFLFAYINKNHPEILSATTNDRVTVWSQDALPHTATNTNPYVTKIPGITGSKTGYTELAGGNLVISIDAGVARPVIIAVLGSTEQGRFEDVAHLAQAALEAIGGVE